MKEIQELVNGFQELVNGIQQQNNGIWLHVERLQEQVADLERSLNAQEDATCDQHTKRKTTLAGKES